MSGADPPDPTPMFNALDLYDDNADWECDVRSRRPDHGLVPMYGESSDGDSNEDLSDEDSNDDPSDENSNADPSDEDSYEDSDDDDISQYI